MNISSQAGNAIAEFIRSWIRPLSASSTSEYENNRDSAFSYGAGTGSDGHASPTPLQALTSPARRGTTTRRASGDVSRAGCSSDQIPDWCVELAIDLRDQAVELSRQADPRAASNWEALQTHCNNLGVNFYRLVYFSVEQVLQAEDWKSAKVLWNILPRGTYSDGRVGCGDEGLFIIRDKKGNGPALLHKDLKNNMFFTGHLADSQYKSGFTCKVV